MAEKPSTRTFEPIRPDWARDSYVLLLEQRVREWRAEALWWKRACWLAALLALLGAGGWAWTVMR